MAKKEQKNITQHIKSLNMNGLRGRVLDMPSPKKKNKQILLLYGHHASIERMLGLAEELNKYGSVCLPDFPGFGGMQSLYKIGAEPDLDALADYLAAFIKMRYNHRRLTIIGMSFGFIVAVRMMQRYPELTKKIDVIISMVGFAHHEDFHIPAHTKLLLKAGSSLFSKRTPAIFARYVFLNSLVIRATYLLLADSNVKMKDASASERSRRINFEIDLWQSNDVRTYARTGKVMLTLDLCKSSKQLSVPVHHVQVEEDRYFDNRIVQQHLAIIFKDVSIMKTSLKGHAPTTVAGAKEAAPFIPRKLRSILKG
ncbi:hypothetical protein BH23PAT2_BH23PAT2_02000 [soil metagenome]